MKTAANALRRFVVALAHFVDVEGAFLLIGTASLAVAASFFSAAGPWIVVGVISLLLALVLIIPARSS